MKPNFWSRVSSRLALTGRVLLHGGRAVGPQKTAGRGAGRGPIPAITPEEIAEARLFFNRPKFFIFGHARSGTTLLVRLIRLHPEVHCNYQAHFFTRPPLLEALVDDPQIESWLARRSNRWNGGRDLSPLVLRAVADFVMEREAERLGKKIVGDKSPSSLLDGEAVRKMHKVYPDAHLVYIVRDGRDTALSHRFQTFIDGVQHLSAEDLTIRDEFALDPEPYLRGEKSVFTENGIRTAAESWVRNVTETDALGRSLYGERYLSLRYEDLLNDPFGQMSRLWGALGADLQAPGLQEALERELQSNPDADWQREKAGEIADPLQKGKRGSWRQMFTGRDRGVYEAIAGETLQSWGYRLESVPA